MPPTSQEAVTSLTFKRRVYTQLEAEEAYKDHAYQPTVRDHLKDACSCSKEKVVNTLLGYVPVVRIIRNYKIRQYLPGDIMAGLSSSFMHLPQGLGFGVLASLTPVYGLYSTFYPLLIYALFGTSQHVSFGTNAVLALLTANIVEREGAAFVAQAAGSLNGTEITVTDEELLNYKVGVAMAAAFMSGLILLIMGLLRLGFLTMYLSVSFVGGFTTAAAVHIATSQVSKMLNIKIAAHAGAGKIVKTYIDIFSNITSTNVADLIIALICIAILLGIKIGVNEKFAKKMKMPVPIDLLLVIVGTLISHFAELNRRFNVKIIGDIPAGLPAPYVPTLEALPRIGTESFVIAILSFAMTISMAKLCARLHDYEIDDNQELVSYGLSNLISSFFGCFPSCTAPPRTMILSSLGAKTTLNGIPAAVFILIVLLAAGQLFVSLPIAVLAAMIVVAMKNLLLQVTQLPNLWRVSKADFVIWLFTFLTSVLGDLDLGIIVGIGVSFLTVIVHTQLSKGMLAGFSKKEDNFIYGLERESIQEIPGVKVFYFNSMLYFANAEKFKNQMFEQIFHPATREHIVREADIKEPTKEDEVMADDSVKDDNLNGNTTAVEVSHVVTSENKDEVHHIIVDCSAMTFIDMGGINVLKLLVTKYKKVDTQIFLACCPKYMIETLERSDFFDKFSRDHVFYQVWDALNAADGTKHLNGVTPM